VETIHREEARHLEEEEEEEEEEAEEVEAGTGLCIPLEEGREEELDLDRLEWRIGRRCCPRVCLESWKVSLKPSFPLLVGVDGRGRQGESVAEKEKGGGG